jgi:hypothetical protein
MPGVFRWAASAFRWVFSAFLSVRLWRVEFIVRGRELVAPAGGEEEDACGGRDREGEAVRTGQLRGEQHQQQDRRRQGGHAVPGPAGAEGDGGGQAHEQGAEDAWRRAGHHGEREHRERGEDRPRGEGEADQTGEGQRRTCHDRQIGAAYCVEVAQPGFLEVRGHLRIHTRDVTDDQAWEESALVGR